MRDRRLHRARVRGVEAEPVARFRQAELLDEDVRELAVVVLPRVDDDLVDARGLERNGERGGLDELWPVPDDGEDLHRAKPTGP